MLGLMQSIPLLVSSLIRHADRHHGDVEIVSRRVEGDLHRYTFSDLHVRAKRLANALSTLGVGPGECVATLAWNGYRHMELYYGVAGRGSIVHTINPRLTPDLIAWITVHAKDAVLCFDLTFLPIVEKIAAQRPTIRAFIALTDRAHMPASSAIPDLECYEELLAAASDEYDWPEFDENTASSLCYTSGTTGNPKGVLYSHRSTMLHTFAGALPDALNLSGKDVILPVVPMFHVNAWGLPYIAAWSARNSFFPVRALDGKSLHDLMESERVTISAGVPTVWQGLLGYMETARPVRSRPMRRTIIGGSALPPAMLRMFEDKYGVTAVHAWGMTEMSPLGTVCTLRALHDGLDREALFKVKSRQGRAIFGVDMKIVDPDGADLPWDGVAFGDLLVRGPWIVNTYLRDDGGDLLCGMPRAAMVPDRRRRDDRSRWLSADHRSQQGRDQVGRGMDQLDRYRECRDGPSGE